MGNTSRISVGREKVTTNCELTGSAHSSSNPIITFSLFFNGEVLEQLDMYNITSNNTMGTRMHLVSVLHFSDNNLQKAIGDTN